MVNVDKSEKTLKNEMDIIICRHCNKKILQPEIIGLTLVCPHCKKSVNGQYHHPEKTSFKNVKKFSDPFHPISYKSNSFD